MRHLNEGACWEYIIREKSIDDEKTKLKYYLHKKTEDTLEMTQENPEIEPDLILYFTEKAILNLIEGEPDAEEYYSRYKERMYNPKPGLEIDNKINKSRLKLFAKGYRKWQSDFNF